MKELMFLVTRAEDGTYQLCRLIPEFKEVKNVPDGTWTDWEEHYSFFTMMGDLAEEFDVDLC